MGKRGEMLININDIIGKRLEKLQVICYMGSYHDMTNGGERVRHYYGCKCDCGKYTVVRRDSIVCELVGSCGCMRGRRANGNKNES